jgi:hypothetical protein
VTAEIELENLPVEMLAIGAREEVEEIVAVEPADVEMGA